ncbi:hypothetical protein BXU11_04885 [Flavobacterium sp. LM5]|nr:hypothetical protein BXU11_04885 [Flavobacterium sp. LM5]
MWKLYYDVQKISAENIEKVGERITQNQRKILECIQHNPYCSAKEMAVFVGISSRKIEGNLKKLKASNMLERVGRTKGGYWNIIKTDI